jgi:hypothetical protein
MADLGLATSTPTAREDALGEGIAVSEFLRRRARFHGPDVCLLAAAEVTPKPGEAGR